jgi:hypothetical protein
MIQFKNRFSQNKISKALPYWLFLCCLITASFSSVYAAPIAATQTDTIDSLVIGDLSDSNTTLQENIADGFSIEISDFEIDAEEDEDDKQTAAIAFNRGSNIHKTAVTAVAVHFQFYPSHHKLFILYHCWKSFLN